MRAALLIVALIATSGCKIVTSVRPNVVHADTGHFAGTPSPSSAASANDFQVKVKPILESHCQPCHFQGGKMYEQLPFDRPETITKLGEKLFTRIKDKEEQLVIRSFLARQKQEGGTP